MSEEHDPTYVPSGALLAHVGLTAKKTDEAWYNVIKTNAKKTVEMEAQNAVAALTLFMRGHTDEGIAAEVGVDASTVKRWRVQGQAILRTVNAGDDAISRAMSATRLGGGVSMALVDAATKIDGDDLAKLEKLETAALTAHVKKSFVTENEKPLTDEQVSDIVTSLPEQAMANLGTDRAPTAKQMLDAIPNVAEAFGIQRKVTKRDTGGGNGGTGPQQLEYHLNLALKDMQAIAKNAEADYVPTPHDYAALFRLCDAIGVGLEMTPEIRDAVDTLVQVQW